MDTRLFLAWLHLLALAVGLSGVWSRARALHDSLRDPENRGALRRAFVGDAWWGVAAGVWIITGLWRLIAGAEKPASYYAASHPFRLKMALFVALAALEAWPMMTFIRWRTGKESPNPRDAGRIEVISYVECILVLGIVLAAAATARGYGSAGPFAPAARATSAAAGAAAAAGMPAPPFIEPTGVETVTDADLALLASEVAMPLSGVNPMSLHSNFDESRGGGTRRHEALDLMAPRRTLVMSAAKGRVLKLFTSANGGLMVYAADSSERFILMYAHLDGYAPDLRDGSPLTRGQLIGYVGSTGNALASAPHLHFAIARSADVKHWSRGKPVDPLPVLQAATHH